MIIQTNVWFCERCNKIHSETEEVRVYEDPIVCLPKGWEYYYTASRRGDGFLFCDDCWGKENRRKV